MSKLKTSELFGQKHVIDIMMVLYYFGDKSRTELYSIISSCQRMPQKLDMMESAGITTTKTDIRCGKKITMLTDNGRRIAEKFINLEYELEGDIEDFKIDAICRMHPELKDSINRRRSVV